MNHQQPYELGREYDFYGVDPNKFKIDNMVLEVVEDEIDGYRSALKEVSLVPDGSGIFARTPLDRVKIIESPQRISKYHQEDDCHEVVSVADGHVWLRFGTENTDDYYPCFCFQYSPKAVTT